MRKLRLYYRQSGKRLRREERWRGNQREEMRRAHDPLRPASFAEVPTPANSKLGRTFPRPVNRYQHHTTTSRGMYNTVYRVPFR